MLNEIIEEIDKINLKKYKRAKVKVPDLEIRMEKILGNDILKTIKKRYDLYNLFYNKISYTYISKKQLYMHDFDNEKIVKIKYDHNFFEALIICKKNSSLDKFTFTKSDGKTYVEVNNSKKKYNEKNNQEKLIESRQIIEYDKNLNFENDILVQVSYIKKNDEYEFEKCKYEEIKNTEKNLLKMSRDSILNKPLFFKYIKPEYKSFNYNPFDLNHQKTIYWIKIEQEEYAQIRNYNVKTKKISKIKKI